ncbi:Immunoglobulin [Trinorchestia longiramus]|nr:Immunoglobulin [Trinorchestia longiramus]
MRLNHLHLYQIILFDAIIACQSMVMVSNSSQYSKESLPFKSEPTFPSLLPPSLDFTPTNSSPIFMRFAYEAGVSSAEPQSQSSLKMETSSLALPEALALVQHRVSASIFPHLFEVEGITFSMYPPLGTLGPYGTNWFPDKYRNNHRNIDRSSTGTPGVEILSIEMPPLVRVGDTINLTCHFRLLGEGQKIYTVNWWRDKDQFYTYNTEKHNNKSSYQFDGIQVDEWHSTVSSVTLLNVELATSGTFKCEVMTEAPAFKTAVMYKNLTVIVPPSDVTLSPKLPAPALYKPGEVIRRFCTATDSNPETSLQWSINGSPATSNEITERSARGDRNGLISSWVAIELVVPDHFHNGRARVSCSATINGHKYMTLSETLYTDTTDAIVYNSNEVNEAPGLEHRWLAALQSVLLISSLSL